MQVSLEVTQGSQLVNSTRFLYLVCKYKYEWQPFFLRNFRKFLVALFNIIFIFVTTYVSKSLTDSAHWSCPSLSMTPNNWTATPNIWTAATHNWTTTTTIGRPLQTFGRPLHTIKRPLQTISLLQLKITTLHSVRDFGKRSEWSYQGQYPWVSWTIQYKCKCKIFLLFFIKLYQMVPKGRKWS